MKHATARQLKWNLVDHMLCMAHDDTGTGPFSDYTPEERQYNIEQVERIARMLNVKDHIYL
jgi:hypothetical protein